MHWHIMFTDDGFKPIQEFILMNCVFFQKKSSAAILFWAQLHRIKCTTAPAVDDTASVI